MTPGQALVFHWRGLPYKAPPNYRGLFTLSRLPGSRWEGKYWNILSAKEQTYWESVGRLLIAAFDSARETARREGLVVIDVEFTIPPYNEDVPLVVPSPPPLAARSAPASPSPAPVKRKRPYRRRARAPSVPPQTPSTPRARLVRSRTEPTLPQLEAVPDVVVADPVCSSSTQAPPLELTFKVQEQPPQLGKSKEQAEVDAWLASQVPLCRDLELERRRIRRMQEQRQAKEQAQAEGSRVDTGKKRRKRLPQQGQEDEQADAQSPKESEVGSRD